MRQLKEQILLLRSEGQSYNKIAEALKCSKSLICYHCGNGQKKKMLDRNRNNSTKLRSRISKKIDSFGIFFQYGELVASQEKTSKIISKKIRTFSRGSQMSKSTYNKPTFSVDQLLSKIGDNPRCYISGEPIDIGDTRSWHLDHIIPKSRGGSNNLDNANVCLAKVNIAKGSMTNEEFIEMCKKVVSYQSKN